MLVCIPYIKCRMISLSSIFSRKSSANAAESIENLEEISCLYYMPNDVCN